MESIRPLIGITGGLDRGKQQVYLRQAYLQAVAAAGGLPVVLPVGIETAALSFYLERLDALILPGGGDIGPAFFGESPQPGLGKVSMERDEFELELTVQAFKRDMPILGICRGMQILNVAAGGDLYQDLPSQYFRSDAIQHQQEPGALSPNFHPVRVVAESRLAQLLNFHKAVGPKATGPKAAGRESADLPNFWPEFDSGSGYKAAASPGLTISVNSRHHQAIRKLAAGLEVSAYAPDGIIEAIETSRGSLVIGVQWHPEDIWEADPRFLGLFQGLVEAAARRLRE